MDNLRYLQRPAAPQHNAKLHEAQPPFVSKVGIALGTLLGFSVDGSPLVDCAENPSLAPVAAKCCADVDEGDCGAQVVVAFEGGDYLRPVVIGVLRSRGPRRWIEARDHSGKADHVDSEQAIVEPDGKRVILTAAETLTLRCGTASITLSRDGTVVIRGAYLQSRSEGVNRIQGGSVQIN